MNNRFLYILTMIAACFTSCIQSTLEETTIASDGEVYLSMSMSTASALSTRAPSDAEIYGWENRVNEVWILLYSENILAYKFVCEVQNFNNSTPGTLISFYDKGVNQEVISGPNDELSFVCVAKKVNRKPYKMAVLANPAQEFFGGVTVGSNLSVLEAVIDGGLAGLDVGKFGSYADNPSSSTLFFMSNANGLVTIPLTALKSTAQEAEGSPVEVHLDRLLAKISVKERQGGASITTSDVVFDRDRPLTWYLDVVNKKTFPIRRFALLSDGTMESESNSTASIRSMIYAEDPNFALADNDEQSFVKWGSADHPPYATWISDDKQDPALRTYQYTFENTMNLATQSSNDWNKYTTCIILDTYLIYKNLLSNPSILDDEDDPGRNYFSCLLVKSDNTTGWMVFTHEQASYWLQTGFPTSTDVSTSELLTLLADKIREVQQDYTSGNANAFNFLASTSLGKDKSSFKSYKAVTYHPLGLNRYSSPVRHFPAGSSNPEKNTYGFYGVVRNNHYTLTINSITGPGTGIYEWDNRFISAQISITPWYKRDFQGEDLQ